MTINHEKKLVFVHIPKNAGISIIKAMGVENIYMDKSIEEYKDHYKDYWNKYKNKKEILKIPKTLSLNHTITYDPNQVLIYNLNLLHNTNIEEKYTYSSPRTTLRLF